MLDIFFKKRLKLNLLNIFSPSSGDSWTEDWGEWDEETMDTRESTPDTDTEGEGTVHASASKWIQDCQLAISPTADLIAISNKDKLVLMTRKFLNGNFLDIIITLYTSKSNINK